MPVAGHRKCYAGNSQRGKLSVKGTDMSHHNKLESKQYCITLIYYHITNYNSLFFRFPTSVKIDHTDPDVTKEGLEGYSTCKVCTKSLSNRFLTAIGLQYHFVNQPIKLL